MGSLRGPGVSTLARGRSAAVEARPDCRAATCGRDRARAAARPTAGPGCAADARPGRRVTLCSARACAADEPAFRGARRSCERETCDEPAGGLPGLACAGRRRQRDDAACARPDEGHGDPGGTEADARAEAEAEAEAEADAHADADADANAGPAATDRGSVARADRDAARPRRARRRLRPRRRRLRLRPSRRRRRRRPSRPRRRLSSRRRRRRILAQAERTRTRRGPATVTATAITSTPAATATGTGTRTTTTATATRAIKETRVAQRATRRARNRRRNSNTTQKSYSTPRQPGVSDIGVVFAPCVRGPIARRPPSCSPLSYLASLFSRSPAARRRFALPESVTLTVVVIGHGTVVSSPKRISCATTCKARVAFGASVRLKAQPTSGWRFRGWTGACKVVARVCVIKLRTCSAGACDLRRKERPRHGPGRPPVRTYGLTRTVATARAGERWQLHRLRRHAARSRRRTAAAQLRRCRRRSTRQLQLPDDRFGPKDLQPRPPRSPSHRFPERPAATTRLSTCLRS